LNGPETRLPAGVSGEEMWKHLERICAWDRSRAARARPGPWIPSWSACADTAVPAKPVPALQGAGRLPSLDPAGSDYRFLQTRLRREQNRLVAAVRSAAW
jgi:hypothetical protein